MKDLRRNEFIDMLEMAELLFEEKDNYISCYIPTLGSVSYFPKADKVQIHRTNKWEEGGFEFIKNILYPSKMSKFNLYPKIEINENYIDKLTSIIKRAEKSDQELRNDFAGLALSGIMASGISKPIQQHQFDNIAEDAYRLADAMVKRSKL